MYTTLYAMILVYINYFVYSGTSFNKGPKDWQNLFAVTRFRYIKVLLHILLSLGYVKKIVCYTGDFII